VAINLLAEHVLDLAEVARVFRVNGRPRHLTTIWRWVTQGRAGPGGGRRVKLETVRLGGRTVTTEEAVRRFLTALNPDQAEAIASLRTPQERLAASEDAARELARRRRSRGARGKAPSAA